MYSLCCFHTAHAQQYGFLNFTTDNGLAQSQVTGMCQDNYGYLWFTTYGGVSRFDGLSFTNYTTANGLYSDRVAGVYKDSDGRIWLGCMGGYSVYEKGAFRSHAFRGDLSQADIVAICEYPARSYWILFDKNYLVNIHNGKSITYAIQDSVSFESRSMTLTADNDFLIATENGVVRFDPATHTFTREKQFGHVNCSYILADRNRTVLATYGEGIHVYEEGKAPRTFGRSQVAADFVRHLFCDNEGNIWASTAAGVSLIDTHYKVTNYNNTNGLIYNNIRFTGQDNEGNIWFGTDGKGILKFTGRSVINYTHITMSVLEDRSGNMWFGTYNYGVHILRSNGQMESFKDAEGQLVWALAQTPDQHVWMGTSQGLYEYDGKGHTKVYMVGDRLGLLADKITSLCVDKKGRLWIGNRNGLNCFYDNRFWSYSETEGITGGNIRCIVPDKKGNLWLAGSAGLFRFDGHRAKLFKFNTKAEDNTVYCLRFDDRDNLWVGTRDGLYLFKNEKFIRIEESTAALSGNINFLMDDREKLWVGTNKGVFEFNLGEYFSKDTTIIRSFGRNEGMIGRETNLNAVYKDSHDNLWFGTDGGLVRIGKKRFEIDTRSMPYVHIDNVKIFFEKPDWKHFSSKPLNDFGFPLDADKVRYNQNHFTFYFTGISLTQPQKVRYRFMLEGSDEDWQKVTDERHATYTNLSPGQYRFKVMAQNANGLWSEKPAVFDFTIIAPFWRTWWFYSLCGIFVILVVILLWRIRLSQIKRKNQTMQLYYKSKLLSLEQQSLNASMNRHFIFNSLNSIQYYINKQDKLEANRYLTNFAKLIRKNLDSAISSDLIPLAEELDRIQLYLSLETMRFKDRFRYEFNIDKNIDPQSIMIPPMLFQPYIENSIWHGILPKEEMGLIQVNIYPNPADANLVNIEIVDDGIGLSNSLKNKIDTGSTHISRGIEITSGRLNLLKKMTSQNLEILGPMDITDPSGKVTGTLVKLVISVKIPLKNEKSDGVLYEN